MYLIVWGFLVTVIFVVDYINNNLGWRETERGQSEGEQGWLRGGGGEESRGGREGRRGGESRDGREGRRGGGAGMVERGGGEGEQGW